MHCMGCPKKKQNWRQRTDPSAPPDGDVNVTVPDLVLTGAVAPYWQTFWPPPHVCAVYGLARSSVSIWALRSSGPESRKLPPHP